MTIERARIKRAARLRWERMNPGISWDNVREDAKAQMEESIARTAADLFPELDGDEPSAWLAPWNLTDAMWRAGDSRCKDDEDLGLVYSVIRDASHVEQRDNGGAAP